MADNQPTFKELPSNIETDGEYLSVVDDHTKTEGYLLNGVFYITRKIQR